MQKSKDFLPISAYIWKSFTYEMFPMLLMKRFP